MKIQLVWTVDDFELDINIEGGWLSADLMLNNVICGRVFGRDRCEGRLFYVDVDTQSDYDEQSFDHCRRRIEEHVLEFFKDAFGDDTEITIDSSALDKIYQYIKKWNLPIYDEAYEKHIEEIAVKINAR